MKVEIFLPWFLEIVDTELFNGGLCVLSYGMILFKIVKIVNFIKMNIIFVISISDKLFFEIRFSISIVWLYLIYWYLIEAMMKILHLLAHAQIGINVWWNQSYLYFFPVEQAVIMHLFLFIYICILHSYFMLVYHISWF